jgi:hypothetical protein
MQYFHKPPYDDLRRTLIVMRDHAASNGVAKIAVPRCTLSLIVPLVMPGKRDAGNIDFAGWGVASMDSSGRVC